MNSFPRIIWLCKRRYMNHDVILDRYARLFELPAGLLRESDLSAVCLDYYFPPGPPVPISLEDNWRGINLPATLFIGWIFQLFAHVRRFKPTHIIASSDCLCVVAGYWLAKVSGARFFADLYDDYSTFGLARIPGLRTLYRRALKGADGLIAVSSTLAEDLRNQYPGKPVLVLESTIDADVFYQRDRQSSRKLLGLDRFDGKKLVGACGGLNNFHGAGTVFEAFRQIMRGDKHVVCVVAGKLYEECPLPEGESMIYLGKLPHDQMPYFYSAMDVVVVPLSDTRFGYYAFPQKAYEVLACSTPAAVADVGALGRLFDPLPQAKYTAGSPQDLARVICAQIQKPELLMLEIPTWRDQAVNLARFMDIECHATLKSGEANSSHVA